MKGPRRLQTLTDREIDTLVAVLFRSADAHRVLDLLDYGSLVRVRQAVQRVSWRDNLHAKALQAQESAA